MILSVKSIIIVIVVIVIVIVVVVVVVTNLGQISSSRSKKLRAGNERLI